MDFTKILLDFFKLTPSKLIAICVCCALLLALPKSILQFLGVFELTQNYRYIVGVALITAFALLISTTCVVSGSSIKKHASAWVNRRYIKKRLCALTEEEKEILRYYIINQTRTNILKAENGVAQGLATAGIIILVSSRGSVLSGFPYNIAKFAWDYLNKNRSLLDGVSNRTYTDIFDSGHGCTLYKDRFKSSSK